MLFEVCADSPAAVLAAVSVGADRVELCSDLAVGGVTPSVGLIGWAAALIPAHVLIRPRGGDFVYSAAEADIMLRDIEAATAAGARGVVVGALTREGAVDLALCADLIAAARPASVTFHRAFDATADPAAAFADVLSLGADRLLTSGAAPTALDGADLIARLVARAGDQLVVLPGGGVTEATAAAIVAATGARELHFSGRSSPGTATRPLATRLSAIMAAATSPTSTPGRGR
jgi:copper homeostasis protein